jgi:hypothetical protein
VDVSLYFATKILYTLLVSTILATCQAHCNLQDLAALTVLGNLYKSQTCVMSRTVDFILLGPDIFLLFVFLFSYVGHRIWSFVTVDRIIEKSDIPSTSSQNPVLSKRHVSRPPHLPRP